MSLTRTSEPSGLARTMMFANSLGSVSRPRVVTGTVNWFPAGAGSRPIRPAGLVVFCSWTAARTSDTVSPSWAMRSGSRLSSIENWSEPIPWASPTPGTRLSSSIM